MRIRKPKTIAKNLVDEIYYRLPNNGLLNVGVNNCQSRWDEAQMTTIITLNNIIKNIEPIISKEKNDSLLNYLEEVKKEITKLNKEYSYQETAIDWIQKINEKRELDKFDFENGKKIEKKQIIDAVENGRLYESGEDYYKQQFQR